MIEHQGIVIPVGAYIGRIEITEVEKLLDCFDKAPLPGCRGNAVMHERIFHFVLGKQRER